MKNTTILRARGLTASPGKFAALLVALVWLTVQPASGQLLPITPATTNLSLSDITVTYGDWETIKGQFTLSNISGLGQTVKIGTVAVTLEYVGESGSTAACKTASVFPNPPAGTTVLDGAALAVTFSAVCTDVAAPLDTHEIVAIITIKLAGSNKVFATSARLHL